MKWHTQKTSFVNVSFTEWYRKKKTKNGKKGKIINENHSISVITNVTYVKCIDFLHFFSPFSSLVKLQIHLIVILTAISGSICLAYSSAAIAIQYLDGSFFFHSQIIILFKCQSKHSSDLFNAFNVKCDKRRKKSNNLRTFRNCSNNLIVFYINCHSHPIHFSSFNKILTSHSSLLLVVLSHHHFSSMNRRLRRNPSQTQKLKH